MPRGDKSKYTDKQKREAEHIAASYEDRGVPEDEAERRAWATVNKESGGGNKSGGGRGVPDTHVSSEEGGKKGGAASASRPAAARSASARGREGRNTGRASGSGDRDSTQNDSKRDRTWVLILAGRLSGSQAP